jgi:hypothetical protein
MCWYFLVGNRYAKPHTKKNHVAELQGVEEEVDEVLNLKFRKFLYFLRKIVIVILKLYRIGLRKNLLPQIDSF